jgi:hypothetical protein
MSQCRNSKKIVKSSAFHVVLHNGSKENKYSILFYSKLEKVQYEPKI